MSNRLDPDQPSLNVGKGAQRFHELSLRDDSEIDSVLELLEQLDDNPGLKDLRVLELACATGRVTLPLAAAGHRVLAVDSHPDLLTILRSRLDGKELGCPTTAARVEVQQADPLSLRTEERFKAVCLMSAAITKFSPEQQRQVLRHAAAHVAPGGMLIVSTDLVAVGTAGTSSVILLPRISLTETVDPAASLRRTVLAWGEESYVTDHCLLPPARLSAELRHLGLSPAFQRSVQDPALPHHSNVVIGASRSR